MTQAGLIYTSSRSFAEFVAHVDALRAVDDLVLKFVTGWGPPGGWTDELRRRALALAPTTIVRTVQGDPSVAGGAHTFLHPEQVIAELQPWWAARAPGRQFLIELGNELLLQPEPDDDRAWGHAHYLALAIAACRRAFPGVKLIAPAHMLNHPVAVGTRPWGQERYLELHAALYRQCDYVGLHAYTLEQYAHGATLVRRHVGDTPLYLTEFALNARLDDATRGRRYAELARAFDVAGVALYHLAAAPGADPVHFNPNYALTVPTLQAFATAWQHPRAATPAVPPPAPAAPQRPPVTNVAMSQASLTRGRIRPISLLILHATAARRPSDFNWLRQGGSMTDPSKRVSVQYYIDRAGQITQFVADHDTAWHAGNSRWHGLEVEYRNADGSITPSVNACALGIELENLNTGRDPYPDAQYQAAVALSRHLVATHGIERRNLVRHLDVSPGRKTDPAGFPWTRFVDDVYRGL
jgi:N-acetyl-anhydromuramyl-L-alanine amidase AmpD